MVTFLSTYVSNWVFWVYYFSIEIYPLRLNMNSPRLEGTRNRPRWMDRNGWSYQMVGRLDSRVQLNPKQL